MKRIVYFFKKEILLFLLENHAKVDTQNGDGNTPLFSATDGHHRECAKLLIEFGANMSITNNLKQNVLDYCKADEFRKFLSGYYEQLSEIVPKIVSGDKSTLEMAYRAFCSGSLPLCTSRSRFINGSTFLHTSSFFDIYELTEKMLKPNTYFHSPFNPNIHDYKGATPLHRCKSLKIIKLLIDYEADVNAVDLEGNCPLHVKCFGERGKHSELAAIDLLLNYGAELIVENRKGFMPIHCAAMQGRVDVIEKLMDYDHEFLMEKKLNDESSCTQFSPVYLALCNDFLDCSMWLVKNGFSFKTNEADTILYKILTEQIIVKDSASIISFLCKNGANLNYKYPGGNNALHYAAAMTGEPKSLKLLLTLGSNINAVNDDLNTPLFMAVLANNPKSVATLIEYGADVRHKNSEGLTAFDLISDLDEWIKYDCFDEETIARLRAYNYKHTRDLIRAISERVKNNFNPTNALMEREQTLMKYMTNSDSLIFGRERVKNQRPVKYSYNL
jgi:ankyrin repeat protein